jgi:hypothetical protein
LLYGEADIFSEIRNGRVRRLGHVERMTEETTVTKVFKNIPEGKSPLESQERDGWMMLKIM